MTALKVDLNAMPTNRLVHDAWEYGNWQQPDSAGFWTTPLSPRIAIRETADGRWEAWLDGTLITSPAAKSTVHDRYVAAYIALGFLQDGWHGLARRFTADLPWGMRSGYWMRPLIGVLIDLDRKPIIDWQFVTPVVVIRQWPGSSAWGALVGINPRGALHTVAGHQFESAEAAQYAADTKIGRWLTIPKEGRRE